MVIGVIGAGASGMAAALAAAENENVQVLLFERQSRVGRKLQATGNGRCNLSNLHLGQENYHGTAPQFADSALSQFGVQDTLAWFQSLGLYTVAEENGKVYPYSDQANSVVDVLRFALNKPNIQLFTGVEIQKIQKCEDGFALESEEKTYHCQKVIVCCGGIAGSKLGGTLSGYQLLGKLGHKATRLRPCLVQLVTGWKEMASLKGVRANCRAMIYHGDKVYAQSTGEVQFTEIGVSGPVIFEISRDVCQERGSWTCHLDLLPHIEAEELKQELRRRRQTNLPMEELLTGILHNRLGRVLTKVSGISGKMARELTDREIQQLCQTVKDFVLPLKEPLGMDSAQVTAGGVLTEGFHPQTMESLYVPGLYACGEVLDIDGDCGGYNLQWAWSSGRVAGLHAGKETV